VVHFGWAYLGQTNWKLQVGVRWPGATKAPVEPPIGSGGVRVRNRQADCGLACYDRVVAKAEVVLFDLGGVLVELAPLDELLGREMTPEDFWSRWLASASVRAFEKGETEVQDFAAALVDDLVLDISRDQVVERFAAFPRGLMPGAAALVEAVSGQATTGVLSNTNQLHWSQQPDSEIIQEMFDHQFLSFELGMVKPDRELFDHVVGVLDMAPSKVIFVDDNEPNVQAARSAGIDAYLAKGPVAASKVLQNNGFLLG